MTLAGTVRAQPTINEVAAEDGRLIAPVSGVSDTGVVCGGIADGSRVRAVLWTAGGTIEIINVPGDFVSVFATAVSANGTYVAGRCGPNGFATTQVFRWSRATGVQFLPHLAPSAYASAIRAVALDGTAVGSSANKAVRWTPDGTVDEVPILDGATSSEAFALSDDGLAIVGSSSYSAISITRSFLRAPGYTWAWDLGAPTCSASVIARGVGEGGSTVVGTATDDVGVARPFRWTWDCERMQPIPVLTGDSSGTLDCVSRDGTVAAGSSGGSYSTYSRAMIWDGVRGSQDLRAYLTSRGADTAGWELFRVAAMSSDGGTLVGSGKKGGRLTTFIVQGLTCGCALPACITDLNRDGSTDQTDVDMMIDCIGAAWACSCFDADLNDDGNVDQGDVDTIVNAIAGGPCPP